MRKLAIGSGSGQTQFCVEKYSFANALCLYLESNTLSFYDIFLLYPYCTYFEFQFICVRLINIYIFKGTGTQYLIWLKVVSLDRSWLVGLTDPFQKISVLLYIFN